MGVFKGQTEHTLDPSNCVEWRLPTPAPSLYRFPQVRPLKNMMEYAGIEAARIEAMEERLKKDVLAEVQGGGAVGRVGEGK